jgi:hypothetical protein
LNPEPEEFSINFMIITIFRKRLNRIARLLELLMLSVLLFVGSAAAQSGDLYIYPAKGQNKTKQDEDRCRRCHGRPCGRISPPRRKKTTSISTAGQRSIGSVARLVEKVKRRQDPAS